MGNTNNTQNKKTSVYSFNLFLSQHIELEKSEIVQESKLFKTYQFTSKTYHPMIMKMYLNHSRQKLDPIFKDFYTVAKRMNHTNCANLIPFIKCYFNQIYQFW